MTSFGFPTLSRSLVGKRTWPFFFDLLIAVAGLACFYGIIQVTHYWIGPPQPSINISLSPRALPVYAFYSIVRIFLAYILSLVFAVGYGYTAAYSPRLEGIMIAALDVLQSIPVLSFLPAVMLAMVALFPTHQIGVEMGAILLIFTGQVWNMAFSFYSSLKSLPHELTEASTIYGFSRAQRLLQLELPQPALLPWPQPEPCEPTRVPLSGGPLGWRRLDAGHLPLQCGQLWEQGLRWVQGVWQQC